MLVSHFIASRQPVLLSQKVDAALEILSDLAASIQRT